MKIEVLYHSTTGNTAKIAQAIAQELGVTASQITPQTRILQADLVFLGDGVYFGKPSKAMRSLLDSIQVGQVKQVAIFGTYGGMEQGIGAMQRQLADKGISVIPQVFSCKGQAWLVINRNLPSQSDLQAARSFARSCAAASQQ